MRILLAGWESPGVFVYGGLGVFGENLVRAFVELGHEVTWVGCAPSHALRGLHRFDGFRVLVSCLVTDLGDRNLFWMWRDLVGSMDVLVGHDLVIVNDYHVSPVVWMAKAYGLPVIYYAHIFGGTPYEIQSMMLSDAVATNSNMMKNIIVSSLSPVLSNIEPKPRKPPVKTVYPAPPRLEEPDQSLVDEIRNRFKGVRILVTGRRQPNKNQEIVARAVKTLYRRGHRVWAFIVGRGWPDKVDEPIVYRGDVSGEELASYYRASDIFVLPSTIEPFGMVALEAAINKLPVVLSENTGVKEVLPSAPTFNPFNVDQLTQVLEELVDNPGARRELGEKLYLEASKRTWKDVALELLRITG